MLSERVKGIIYYIDLSCVCCCKCLIGEYGIIYIYIYIFSYGERVSPYKLSDTFDRNAMCLPSGI